MKCKKSDSPENCARQFSGFLSVAVIGAFLCGIPETASASVRLPSTVSNNMVIQRDQPFVLSGRATPGASLSVSFGEEKNAVVADGKGAWQTQFPPMPAEVIPRDLQIVGDDSELTFTNIVVGDVYLVTGTSFGPQVRKSKIDPALLKAAFQGLGHIRLLTVGGQRESFENPETLYESGYIKYGAWRPVDTIISHTPLFLIGLEYGFANSQVPKGLVFADAGTERLEAIIPATRYREEGLIELADEAEAFIPGTACGDAAISKHVAAVQKWFDASAEALDAGRIPAEKCPVFKELKNTEYGSVWNGILSPLRSISITGVIVSEATTRDPDELCMRKEKALAKCYRMIWGDSIDVLFHPASDKQIDASRPSGLAIGGKSDARILRGESCAEKIIR
ncbi:MAG: hypothetical protein ACI4QT_02240 [Kiritimatiellia bacterium]